MTEPGSCKKKFGTSCGGSSGTISRWIEGLQTIRD